MAESLGQIPFGNTHKGKDIEDCPTDYLTWLKGEKWFQDKYPALRKNILAELKYRERFGDPE
jgi:uncharacterized protein (DUF3820 family)